MRGRTAAPGRYVVATYLCGPYLLLISWVAAQMGRWSVSVVSTSIALIASIAAMAFVPRRSAWEDLTVGRAKRRFLPRRRWRI